MNELDLNENEPVGGTQFYMNGFTQRLILKQRQKAARKWQWAVKTVKPLVFVFNKSFFFMHVYFFRIMPTYNSIYKLGFLNATCTCMTQVLNIHEKVKKK